jgi:hypothetical protein
MPGSDANHPAPSGRLRSPIPAATEAANASWGLSAVSSWTVS